jgi:DNA helicase-2/ATP-dependent DNA helicase PcrA
MDLDKKSGLNEAQMAAARHSGGPALVLAGAGSGKTRVIVERLSWLVSDQNADTRSLLALTFTNRAANEMRERVAARLGVSTLTAWVGTFHSFGLYLLRREIDKLGRKKAFTIFDDADQLSLMKRLIKDLPAGMEPVTPREALSAISRCKQALKSPEELPEENDETVRRLWHAYHETLVRAGAVDFDDLLVLPVNILRQFPDTRKHYAGRYKYIHIDEYQDTNHAQYEFARLISHEHGNIFAVGDEDQSIYSWRGADINNILDFERDFPQARIYRLEQNYRSTEAILRVANAVVANNTMRLGKTLWTSSKGGEKVRFYLARDGEDEARFVVDEIESRKLAPDGVGVLFRTNGQSRLLEEAFRRAGVPYRVVGATEFYSRKEVKDILAYLRLLSNPADDVSLRRVINIPVRGIGATTFERIEEYAKQRKLPLIQVLRDIEHDQSIPARTRGSINEFVQLIDEFSIAAKQETVAILVPKLIERIAYREHVRRSDEKDMRSRLEIVDEFVASCSSGEATESTDLAAFLQELSLLTDRREGEIQGPAATLLTCHSAKGLEFDHVFLIGLEEGLLPHVSAFDSAVELEEERRLCYVAMTRARKTLTLACTQQRNLYGERRESRPSRFLAEVPREWVDPVIEAEAAPAVQYNRRAAPAPPGPRRISLDGPETGASNGLATGTKVRHMKFGSGVVVSVSGSGKSQKARIRFQSGPARDFLVAATPLEILEGGKK